MYLPSERMGGMEKQRCLLFFVGSWEKRLSDAEMGMQEAYCDVFSGTTVREQKQQDWTEKTKWDMVLTAFSPSIQKALKLGSPPEVLIGARVWAFVLPSSHQSLDVGCPCGGSTALGSLLPRRAILRKGCSPEPSEANTTNHLVPKWGSGWHDLGVTTPLSQSKLVQSVEIIGTDSDPRTCCHYISPFAEQSPNRMPITPVCRLSCFIFSTL